MHFKLTWPAFSLWISILDGINILSCRTCTCICSAMSKLIFFYPTECNMSLCDAIIPTCKPNEKLVVGYHPLSCCPQYRCGKGNTKTKHSTGTFSTFVLCVVRKFAFQVVLIVNRMGHFKEHQTHFLCLCFVSLDLQSVYGILFY